MTAPRPSSEQRALNEIRERDILALLKRGPVKSIADIGRAIGASYHHAVRHIEEMCAAGTVRKVRSYLGDGRISPYFTLELGAGIPGEVRFLEPNAKRSTEKYAPKFTGEARQVKTTATQIGVTRDPMIAAIFGARVA